MQKPWVADSIVRHAVRLIGVALLVILLASVDRAAVSAAFLRAALVPLTVAFLLNVPQLWIKSVRWRGLLAAGGIQYGVLPGFIAYAASLFAGLLTPGRLGELIKAAYVMRECQTSLSRALSSVLLDRLYDLTSLVLIGTPALFVYAGQAAWPAFIVAAAGVAIGLAFFLHDPAYLALRRMAARLPVVGRAFGHRGLVDELRDGMLEVSWSSAATAAVLTISAQAIVFLQCYLVATSVHLPIGLASVIGITAVGNIVALLPISISGVGTRDAALFAMITRAGGTGEAALAYSLLFFAVFYVGGGALGALAWWINPISLSRPTGGLESKDA